MAQDQNNTSNTFTAAFPAPPPFYKHFTIENQDRLKQITEAADQESQDVMSDVSQPIKGKIDIMDLPSELRYLMPPEPPATGKYRCLGDEFDVHDPIISLKDAGMEQLYPSPPTSPSDPTQSEWTLDRALYLKKMARSLILNFLELVGVLAVNPLMHQQKIQDLHIIFQNAHALINEYRPHQARETLILMMEDQLEKKRTEVEGIKAMRERIGSILETLGTDGLEKVDMSELEQIRKSSLDEARRSAQRSMWQALEEMD